MKSHRGFTLVELLVVIAIIGLLSTIAFISLNRARAKARDAKRVADMRNLETALNLFYELHQHFPCSDNLYDDSSASGVFLDGRAGYDSIYCPSDLVDVSYGLVTEGILPATSVKDPINAWVNNSTGEDDFVYLYVVAQDFQSYRLLVNFETGPDLESTDGGFCDEQYERWYGDLCMTCSSNSNCLWDTPPDYGACSSCPLPY